MSEAARQAAPQKAPAPAREASTRLASGPSCACGSPAGLDGLCEGCRGERLALQRSALSSWTPNRVPAIVHEVLRSPGRPLEPGVRANMESHFGHDFSHVCVHANPQAARSAQSVNAQAYTVGQDMVFGEDQYDPGSPAGRRLLAHELTHTLQQRSSPDGTGAGLQLDTTFDQFEAQARGSAEQLANAPFHVPIAPLQTPAVRLQGQFITPIAAGDKFGGLMERDRRSPPQEAFDPVSIEVSDAPPAFNAQERLRLWLISHRQEIIAAEGRHVIDRRAIAGAIAWEGLENIRAWYGFGFARFSSYGKVHYKENFFSEGEPVSKEVEERGFMPPQSEESRRVALTKPGVSIEYIASIMDAYAEEAETAGYNIRNDPAILATFFNGVKAAHNLRAARAFFLVKRFPQELKPNPMGLWVSAHLPMIESAVGKPSGLSAGQAGMGDLKLREAVSEERRRRTAPAVQQLPGVSGKVGMGDLKLREAEYAEKERNKPQPKTQALNPDLQGEDAQKLIDAGQKRADAARQMVNKLRATGTKYRQETQRDWDDYTLSDCSKFVQWTLEQAGQGELFGREQATAALIQQVIARISQEGQGIRESDPRIGDIMIWGGHVGIVTDVSFQNSVTFLEFAAMGSSGASLTGSVLNDKGERKFWLKASDVPSRKELGRGEFKGYWTP